MDKILTVKELKELLNNAPDDYEVLFEYAVVGNTSNCYPVREVEVDNELDELILKMGE